MTMNTTASFSAETFFHEARHRALRQALLRPESLVIIALSMLMIGLCLLRVFWFPATWPIWGIFGIVGVSLIVFLSMKDEKFMHQVSANLFYERFDQRKLKLPELQRTVTDALEYHRLLFGEITRRPYAPLGTVASDMDRLVASVYHLAHSLDQFVSNEQIKQYLLYLLEGRNSSYADPIETIDEYTTALVALSAKRAATGSPFEQSYLLDNVCYVVASARGQLQNTIKNISAVHQRIAVAPSAKPDADWSFVDTVHASLADHLTNVEDRTVMVRNLYEDCETAAELAKKQRQTTRP
jgi:hypothetical protein